MINTYNQHGWVHLHNVIPANVVYELRTRAIEWRNWVKDKINQPCEYGPKYHWNGLGCAGMYDSYLMDFYTSDTPRCLYACVYSASRINHQKFYTNKFHEPVTLNFSVL